MKETFLISSNALLAAHNFGWIVSVRVFVHHALKSQMGHRFFCCFFCRVQPAGSRDNIVIDVGQRQLWLETLVS